MLTTSSVSVINVDDGNGVVSVNITYAIGSSPTTPPGSPLVDGGVVLVDMNGVPLTDASWQTTIPTVPNGSYLWTRTITTFGNGDFAIAYVVGYSGEDGVQGAQGVSIADSQEQWYLSNSSSSLTGGSWSYTEPSPIPDGKYLWGRWEITMSDGTIKYSDAVYRSTIAGLKNITDTLNQKISQKIWATDITNSIDQYDGSTGQAIRDRVTQTESDISGITSRVSATESSLLTKADGTTVTNLANTVTQNKQTADAFQQTVTSTYAKLTDVDTKIGNIKIGGENLYIMKDGVTGYLHASSGVIQAQSSTYKEMTSDYITVKEGEEYVLQSWATPTTTGGSWLAYQYFKIQDGATVPLANRVAKCGSDSGSGVETTADGQEHLTYKITVPANAKYIRMSYRKFTDGYAMIEKANTPSEYAINPEDLENYADNAVSTAKSEIKQTTDAIELTVSSKVGASEIISKINQSPENITIQASKVDLVGQVTFTMFDSDTQNALTSGAELILGTQASSTSAWTGKSTKLSSIGTGTRISYKLPYASTSTAVTLNLTLNNNTTTGAKNVYYLNDTRLTTQYGVNSIVELIYDGSAWRVINPYSDANTYDRTRYQQAIKAGSTAIVAKNIIVAGANNVGTYTHLKLGNAFDTTYPILYAGSAIAANKTGTDNYLVVPMGLTTTQSGTYTAYKAVYIKGTLSGTTFTPVSTTPLTQTIPSSADNYHYMLLGTMYSTTEMYLLGEHPIFQYYNGGFKTTTQIAAEAAATATSANATANTASQNASDALSAVNASIKSTTMHYLATTAASGVTRSTSGWTTTIQSITASKRYLWTYQTITKVDNTTSDTDPVISGVWGNTGTSVTVSSNVTTYQAGTSGTTAPTGTWQSTVPTVADGQFLWTKVVTTFSDNSTATSYSVAKQGIQGTSVTVSSTSTTYQSGTSGTSAPTGTWQSTIPTVAQGNYLWTKTVVTYSDGKSTTSYAVSYQSEDGDTGVSVTKVEQLYRSSNSTTAPAAPTSVITSTSTANSTWTLAMPTYDATYKYYYTCTQTTYSDGSHTWTTVARSKAIEDANATANTANSNASAAVQTANTANTNASAAVEAANSANDTANAANEKAKVGLGMKVNYENFSTANAGECYLHGYTNGVAADVDGYVYWNDIKRTVPKKMINPNATAPYWSTIYIVYRLSSASATTGTLYIVWYNSGWKYAVTPTPSAVGGTWTWAETTDIVLGQFIEPSSEGQIVDAYLYDPPRNASHIQSTGSNSYQYAKNSVDWVSTNGANVLTAKNIINNWATDATKTNTTIKGGLIQTHTILSEALATNAIMSSNYSSGVAGSDTPSGAFSQAGSFLDLATGNIYMPNFGVDAVNGAAYINGTVYGTAGRFGADNTSYWNIETVYDYANQPHASLVGVGSPYIQTGNWQVSDNAVSTRKYTSTTDYSGKADYYKDSGTNTFYDVGVKIPTNFAGYSANDNTATRYNKAFFYGRKYTGNTAPSFDSDWTYIFMVDTDGYIYENGTKLSEKYASIDGVSGAYLPLTGGTITGNLTVTGTLTANASTATKWASAQKVYVTLGTASTTTTIQGGSTSAQTIGVNGTLAVGNGGTGATSFTSGTVLIGNGSSAIQTRSIRNNTSAGALGWTSSSTDTTLVTTNTIAYWNGAYRASDNASNIEYVKLGKLGTVVTHAFDEFITTSGGTINGGLSVIDLTVGDLVVTGAASFTNGISGDLSGTATQVSNNLKIQLNGGTTEGTNQFTYNGSATKNVNITKSSIGLGNVENITLSTWAGSSNLTTTKVGTLATAATKGVDTSISAGSTSTNLPTSKAVATFVEGKGYVTSSGVTSITLKAGTGISLDTDNTAITSIGSRTISLANTYGDTKNPYGTKTKNYVLAGPTTGSAAAPTFRALVADDIPTLTPGKAGLGNVTNNKQVKGLSSGTTSGNLVSWGADGYTVADSGVAVSSVNKTVKSLASNNDGKIVLTYLDGTTSDPIEVKIIGSSGSSVSYADALNVNGTAVGGAEQPVFINNQGKPQTANKIPKLNNGTTGGTFYAPTGAGTSGQVLTSSGGTPSWTNQSSLSVGTAANVSASAGTANHNRHVWFSDDTTETKRVYDDDFQYNPATNTLTVANVSGNASSATKLTTSAGDWSVPVYFSDGKPVATTYLNLHPENANSMIIPFFNNDWAYLIERGGAYEIYSTTATSFTSTSINKTAISVDLTNAFDASYTYIGVNRPQTETTVIDITCPATHTYTNTFYIDFGSSSWRANSIQVLAYNTATESEYVSKGSITNNTLGHWKLKFSHSSTNTSGTTVQGFNRVRIVLSGWANTQNRIAQIGLVNYGSFGTRLTYMSRGIDDGVYRSISPAKNNHYDLGSSSHKWANVYATTFSGNATSATKATQDSDGNTINSTYLKRSGGTMTGTLRTNGTDIILGATGTGSAPNDSGDLVWQYGTGTEKMRIYTANSYTAKSGPNFRLYNENNEVLYTGKLPLADGTDAIGTWGISITGSAATATKATQDGNGANIASTYAKLAGATFTGAVTGTSFGASSYITVNSGNSGTAGGLALYSTTPTNYGITMRTTTNQGRHGYVQDDWATYFCMQGTSTANGKGRGWIFKNTTTDPNAGVASISGAGNAVFDGSVTVGGNAANTSGVRMEYSAETESLNFIFN